MIPLFDLHCDTIEELYLNGFSLSSSPLHISLDKCSNFMPYIQVMAIWSDYRLSPYEAYERYIKTVEYAKALGIKFVKKAEELRDRSFILAIEDAKIAENDISRLEKFKEDGVKIITLCWRDQNNIGGAWNTSLPLTKFGEEFVKKCFELSIIPDISHCSVPLSRQVIKMAEKHGRPVIASHSNSYSVSPHERNLRDEEFIALSNMGALVGISLAPEHLTNEKMAEISHILAHISHYLEICGENTVSLGCDFDGVAKLPNEISDISDLSKLYDAVKAEFGEKTANKIFFENAYNFFIKNLD